MKKIMLCLLAFIAMGEAAKAQTITVADVEAVPGETVAFSVNLSGGKDNAYTAFQFDVQFPATGFTTTGNYTVSSSWPNSSAVVGDVDATGLATVPFASASAIQGTDVEGLVSVCFKVDESVATGNYDVTLKNIFLGYNFSDKDYPADVTFKVKVVDRVTLDENATTMAHSGLTNVNVIVKRTINANEWSTLCLPFDMTKEQVKTIFDNDVKVYYFDSYTTTKDGDNITALTVNFEEEDFSEGFVKNYPYIIKTSKDITEFTVDGVDIDPDEDNAVAEFTNGKTGNKKVVYGTCKGIYQANTTVPENSLFLSGNKFWYSMGATKMKAFRAYFDFNDVLTDKSANARIDFNFEDEATGIKEVHGNANVEGTYDLQGRKVEEPAKGLYIVNGKKTVIK